MDTKTCSGPCGIAKSLDDFYCDKSKKDGRASTCKECVGMRAEEWRKKNRLRHLSAQSDRSKKYRATHVEKVSKMKKNYVQKNKEKIRDYEREYRKRKPDVFVALRAKHRSKRMENLSMWKAANSAYVKRYRLDRYSKERESVLEKCRLEVAHMSARYVANLIGGRCSIPARDIPEDLIALKRQQLLNIRFSKQLKQELKNVE